MSDRLLYIEQARGGCFQRRISFVEVAGLRGMGVIFSCAFTSSDDLDTLFESSRDKVFSFGGDDSKASILLVPKAQDPNLSALRSSGSGKIMIPRSPASGLNPQMMIQSMSLEGKHASVDGGSPTKHAQKPLVDSDGRKYQAAVKLQKTYKSFRTRRQLADCAVLMEQKWWSLVEHYHLKRSSISFFEVEKPQTAVSRWSRGKTKAAKVGKGLLRDEKARKLALQHWLEAIDPRHRYGHNLQFYYTKWLHCTSKQPFFYWLDVGEGRDVNLERCPRTKLHLQCIKYLDPAERSAYEVIIVDGKLMYKQTRELLDTTETPEDVKWIFVLSVHKVLYVGQKKKGTFQHSSFLSGGATLSAGRLVVEEGILKAVWPHSGHYLPTEENFEELISYLSDNNVDLSVVQRAPSNGEEDVCSTTSSLRTSTSVPDLKVEEDTEDTDASIQHSKDDEYVHPITSRWSRRSRSKISPLTIPSRRSENVHELFLTPKPRVPCTLQSPKSPSDGYETPEDMLFDDDMSVPKHNLFDNEELKLQEPVSKEKIMKRINSHKGMKSYQLAKQLSCRWTTGAGPRIGCVRDYPSELQSRVLEEVCLSPQSASSGKSERLTFPHRVKSPLGISSAIAEE